MGDWLGVACDLIPDQPYLGAFGEHGPGFGAGAHYGRRSRPHRLAAPTDLPIIIEGETGTGKELARARFIPGVVALGRSSAMNCAALPEAMAEGELFGYGAAHLQARTVRAGSFSFGGWRNAVAGRDLRAAASLQVSCCACWNSARSFRSARRGLSRSMCGCSRRLRSRWVGRWSRNDFVGSVRAARWTGRSSFRRCGIACRTFRASCRAHDRGGRRPRRR